MNYVDADLAEALKAVDEAFRQGRRMMATNEDQLFRSTLEADCEQLRQTLMEIAACYGAKTVTGRHPNMRYRPVKV